MIKLILGDHNFNFACEQIMQNKQGERKKKQGKEMIGSTRKAD